MAGPFARLGLVSYQAGVLPKGASLLVVAGTVLMNLPTEPVGPVPWIVSVAGGVVMGLGLLLWGRALGTGLGDLAGSG